MRNCRILSIGVHLYSSVVPSAFSPCPLRLRGSISFAVLFLALLIRGGVLLLTPGALAIDPDGYGRLAENLVEHGTYGVGETPTAFRPPLYPLLLTACVALSDHSRLAIGVLHVILGVATVWLVFVLGRWWGVRDRIAALAALLVACDPILLSQSTQVMTETPAAFLATAGLVALTWASQRPTVCRTMSAGAVLGLGALCRPTLLLWAIAADVVLCLQAWTACRSDGTHQLTAIGGAANRLRLPLAFALGAAIVLSPWTIRNQLQFGRPIVTTSHGGYTLLLANNPEFYQWLRSGAWGSVWHSDVFNAEWDQRRPRDEVQADRLAYTEAWQNIHREPGTFVYACLVRIGRLWSPLPHQSVAEETPLRRLSRHAVAVWYVAEFLFVLLGVVWHWLRNRENDAASAPPSAFPLPPSPSWLWGLLLVACLTAVHTAYWTDMRMRAPLMPVIALVAAVGMWTAYYCGSKLRLG
jgi:hypothetical protein